MDRVENGKIKIVGFSCDIQISYVELLEFEKNLIRNGHNSYNVVSTTCKGISVAV